jgi:energy-coupling factor transport system ATP-binding protein
MKNETLLTVKELNDFKLKLNDFNDVLVRRSQKMIEARAEYARAKITKEELTAIEKEYKEKQTEFKTFANVDIYKENVKNAKAFLNSCVRNSKEYWECYEDFKLAQFLLKEAKYAIRERGRSGELFKLNDIALKLTDLKFKYRDDFPLAVNNVNVEVKAGEYVAIIGHNGSGKSTLSKLIIGVLTPTSGTMKIFGNKASVNNLTLIRRFLGIVFQNPDNQFIGSTVRDDIAFGLENRRVPSHKMNKIIDWAAKKVNMFDFLDHEPLMLSGGQKQRVAIASALALSPDILIFDEATSMLDPKGKTEVKEIMVELKNTREKTIFSITHDMDEILNADKVMVMNHGELVRFGTPDEVLKDKDFLRSIHLDIPFVSQVEEALADLGIKLSPSKDMDELAVKLCNKN